MSEYLHQEFDFIKRTKTIIGQYNNLILPQANKFEITLLLNCLTGLLILPKEHWFDFLPNELISKKEWGINPSNIFIIGDNKTKSIKNVVIHLRNSVSHYRFKVFSNSLKIIKEIKFEDFKVKNDQQVKTFEAAISIADFRQFISKFSDTMIETMEKQK